jgi:hypothetical protein
VIVCHIFATVPIFQSLVGSSSMTAGIFISYRRQDTIATAGRLHDRLAKAFGKTQIFMDVDHIPAGADFTHHIESELAKCGVLLVLIGPNWLHIRDDTGSRRLLDPQDLVASEIDVALRRRINVIPVLVDGATLPRSEDLPDPLRPLIKRNAVELRNVQFGADADRLVGRIGELLKRRTSETKRKYLLIGIVLLAGMISSGVVFTSINILWPTVKQIKSVEDCDLVGTIKAGLKFSGIFDGIIVDSGQSGAAIQLKLVRDQNSVMGSYFRGGICGSIVGEVTADRMLFSWHWAGNFGRGIATQTEDRLSGTSGFNTATEGGGTFTLFVKRDR